MLTVFVNSKIKLLRHFVITMIDEEIITNACFVENISMSVVIHVMNILAQGEVHINKDSVSSTFNVAQNIYVHINICN